MKAHSLRIGVEREHSKKERKYKLTSQQRGLWFYYKLNPQDNSYNTFVKFRITGELNVDRFLNALHDVISFFPSFRTYFSEDSSGVPYQVISPEYSKECINYRDLTNASSNHTNNKRYALKEVKKAIETPFDLLHNKSNRFLLIKVSPQDFYCACVQHHIHSDAQSSMLFTSALTCAYNGGKEELQKHFSSKDVGSYFEYLENDTSNKSAINTEYWTKYLKNKKLTFDFGSAFTTKKTPIHTSKVTPLYNPSSTQKLCKSFFGSKLKSQIRSFCKANRTTPFIFLTAIWSIALRKSFNNQSFLLGYPVNIRPKEYKNIFGYYVSTLPLSIEVDDNATFTEFLNQITSQRKIDRKHEEISLNEIIQNSNLSSNDITDFNVSISQSIFYSNFLDLDGVQINKADSSGEQEQDLSFTFDPQTANMEFWIRYNNDIFSNEYIALFKKHLLNLTHSALSSPFDRISHLNIFSQIEFSKLTSGFPSNSKISTNTNISISHEFSMIASRFPRRSAISSQNQYLTYQELESLSNKAAWSLINNDVRPGDVVAILTKKSSEYIIAILAILKTGAAFLPIDPELPEQRVSYILNDSRPKILLKEENTIDLHPTKSTKTLLLGTFLKSSHSEPTNDVNLAEPSQIAYIIYTSGTTGAPKGVTINHSAIKNNISYFISKYQVTENDSTIFKTNQAFDTSIQEIFGLLIAGGKLVILPAGQDSDLETLRVSIEKEKISILQFTPSLLKLYLQNPALKPDTSSALRYIFVGGEQLESNTAGSFYDFFPSASLVNAYGPTECCIDVLHQKIEPGSTNIFLGEAISNVKLYILDDHLNPVPYGTSGQLCISGSALTNGYLNKASLTRARLVENPHGEGKYNKLYLTGDLAKMNSKHEVTFLGRIDRQIKLRGYRIELEEIESALNSLDSIKDSVAIFDENIYAYITPEYSSVDVSEIKKKLATLLPPYMLPSSFTIIDQIPVNNNGKVDVKALPKIVDNDNVSQLLTHIAPSTRLEKELAQIWSEILNTPQANIGVTDSFFDLGGHSLKAIELTYSITKHFNCNIEVHDIFNHHTISDLAELLSTTKQSKSPFSPIPPLTKQEYFQTSQAQKRLFILKEIIGAKEDISFNIPFVLRLTGKIEEERVALSLQKLVERHEAFRTSFHFQDGNIVQKIHDNVDFNLELIDNQELNETEIRNICRNLVKPFNLASSPLIRASLLKTSNCEAFLFIDKHHIISDGISLDIFLNEFRDIYQKKNLEPLHVQYKDYTSWHNEFLESDIVQKQRKYWLHQLSDVIPVIDLPYDYPRPRQTSLKGARIDFTLAEKETLQVRIFCKAHEITEYQFFLSCFGLLLHKYSGQSEINIGSPVAGRRHPDSSNMIGFFVNLICLKLDFNSNISISDYIQQSKNTFLDAIANQDYPFDSLVDDLNIERDLSHHPLFDVVFNFLQEDKTTLEVDKQLHLSNYELENNSTKHDLTLNCTPSDNIINLQLEFATNLFHQNTMVNIVESMQKIIHDVSTIKNLNIGKLNALTAKQEQQVLYDWNNTDTAVLTEETTIDLFNKTAALYPNKTALYTDNESLTYQDIEKRSNQLARLLVKKSKITNGQIVALLLSRSSNMLISLLAIQKAGLTYLPLDLTHPETRLKYILDDSQAKIVLTDNVTANIITLDSDICNFNLDQEELNLLKQDPGGINLCLQNQVAYLIYTSGTTGKPKGVKVSHANLYGLVKSFSKYLPLSSKNHFLAITTISFDIAALEIFLPLTIGATVTLANDRQKGDPHKLASMIADLDITHMQATPSTWKMMLKSNWDGSNKITAIVGGEYLSTKLVNELTNKVANIYNAYGPTETTIWSIVAKVDKNDVSLGKPIANTKAYILDKKLQPVPIGRTGDLYIAGAGVTLGYHNNEKLSKASFLENPFVGNNTDTKKYGTMYKTGDVVRYDNKGNLNYLGRSDYQVKIRGHRVELEEIESILNKLPNIDDVIVISKKGQDGEAILVSYYTETQTTKLAATQDTFKSYLAQSLPQSMIPSFFIKLEEFPLTGNGKIDRNTLNKLSITNLIASSEFIAPSNELEKKLLDTWSSILDLPQNKISISESFFNLGGHSLKAIELCYIIAKSLHYKIELRDIFNYSTIQSLSKFIAGKAKSIYSGIDPLSKKKSYPSSQAQKRLFILKHITNEKQGTSYNMPFAVSLDGEIDSKKINSTFRNLIKRHEVFRTSCHFDNNQVIQKIHDQVGFDLEIIDGSKLNEKEIHTYLNSLVQPFDLNVAPLIRATLLTTNSRKAVLFVDQHHIISDGISTDIFLKEFSRLYQGQTLPSMPIQYKDYSAWHNDFLSSDAALEQKKYWLKQIGADLPSIELPYNYPRPKKTILTAGKVGFSLPSKTTAAIKAFCRKHDITEYIFFLSCFGIVLHKYSGQDNIHIGSPVSGRRHPDSDDMLGFFINILCLKLKFNAQDPISNFITQTKNTVLDGIANQDYPFDALVDNLKLERDLSHHPLFDVMFNFQTSKDLALHLNDDLKAKNYNLSYDTTKFDITLNCSSNSNNISFDLEYAKNLFKKSTIERLSNHLVNTISMIIDDNQQELKQLSILTPEEDNIILQRWSTRQLPYNEDRSITDLLHEQANLTPNTPALTFEHNSLTYQELHVRANRLAHYLTAQGIKNGDKVAILLPNSSDLIVSIIAILKTGSSFIPLNDSFSPSRIAFILSDTEAQLLLTHKSIYQNSKINYPHKLFLDDNKDINNEKSTDINKSVSSQNLCYVLYTSGTTGTPKGVQITHQNLHNYLINAKDSYQDHSNFHFPLYTNIAFDLTITSIFLPLINGGSITIEPKGREPSNLDVIAGNQKIDSIKITPSHLKTLLFTDELYPNIKLIIVGGEAFSEDLAQHTQEIFPEATIYNEYGPTEATIGSIIYQYQTPRNHPSLLIGKPFANTQAYIVDSDLNPLPIGCCGELLLGGDSISPGYLNLNKLNKEKFISNPFSHSQGTHLYKTGDLAKWTEDGNIEYLGRNDNQVQIRGHRVEIDGVSLTLNELPNISDSIVISQIDNEGNQFLIAYYIEHEGEASTQNSIRQALTEKLSNYMIPSFFIKLDKFPLTVNGKIDLKILPAIESKDATKESDYIAPRNDLEKSLSTIWAETLDLPQRQISINSNFFDLGGHSLKAIRLAHKLKMELNINIDIEDIFLSPTIEGMSTILAKNKNTNSRILTIKNNHSKNNLYYIHSGSGSLREVIELTKHLNLDLNFYGIKVQNHDNFVSLADQAEEYLNIIKKHTGGKPFSICGWSYGGLLAHQIKIHSSQSLEKGLQETIAIDSTPFRTQESLSTKSLVNYTIERLTKINNKDNKLIKKSKNLDILYQNLITEEICTREEVDKIKNTVGIVSQHIKISQHMTKDVITQDVHYILAENQRDNMDNVTKILNLCAPKTLVSIPGDHFSIFERKNISSLATALSKILIKRKQ